MPRRPPQGSLMALQVSQVGRGVEHGGWFYLGDDGYGERINTLSELVSAQGVSENWHGCVI